MLAEVTKKLFTVDEYYRMVEVGILLPRDRVELIEGEILEMSPLGPKHMSRVDRATDILFRRLTGRAQISIQSALRLNRYNEPQPDAIVLRSRADFYDSSHRTPSDALFVMEVSDTSLRFDLKVKVPLYAKTGVPEVWIENIKEDLLLIFRNPTPSSYSTQLTLRRGDTITPLAFPDIAFKAEDFLG